MNSSERSAIKIAVEYFLREIQKPEIVEAFVALAKSDDRMTNQTRRRELAIATAEWLEGKGE